MSRDIFPKRIQRHVPLFQHAERKRHSLPERLVYSPDNLDLTYPPVLRNAVDTKDRGASNFGILEMRQKDGSRIILKLSSTGSAFNPVISPEGKTLYFDGQDISHPTFSDYLFIHHTLGELGYALKLRGVIPRDELYPFLGTLDQKFGTQFQPYRPDAQFAGLVLENIAGAWNITRRETIPPYLRLLGPLQVEKVLERIAELENALNAFGIDGQDFQVFLSPDGRVLLGDLDDFRLAKGDEMPNSLDKVARYFVKAWEQATGKKFARQAYREILKRKKRDPQIFEAKNVFRNRQKEQEERLNAWYRKGGKPPDEYFRLHPLPEIPDELEINEPGAR